MRQLLDVVHQAVELPLRIDFLLSAQGEAIEPLVVPKVAEHGLHRGEPAAIQRPPALRINRPPHPVRVALCRSGGLAAKETYLPGLGLLRCP